ncbi:MAG: radical SAM protein [bacterium]
MMTLKEENKKLAWTEFSSGSLRLESRPFRASIEITRNCDLRCVMCAHSWEPQYTQSRPEYDMTPELFRKIAAELFPYLEQAHLQGFGESVISSHWPEILEACKLYSKDIRFTIVTNLNKKDDGMWRKMVRMGFKIIFSCDGATPGTFEAIRRGSRFERILSNLEAVRKARESFKGPELCFLVTLQSGNYREMPLFIDLAARYGAEKVVFSNIHGEASLLKERFFRLIKRAERAVMALRGKVPGEDPIGNLRIYDIPRRELSELRIETLHRAELHGVRVSFIDNFFERTEEKPESENGPSAELPADYIDGIASIVHVARYKKCFKPFSYVVINYKGDIGPCSHLLADGVWEQMGNIRDTGITDIWNCARYRQFRRTHLCASPTSRDCKWCYAHRITE